MIKYLLPVASLLMLVFGVSIISAQEDNVGGTVEDIPAGQQMTISYQATACQPRTTACSRLVARISQFLS